MDHCFQYCEFQKKKTLENLDIEHLKGSPQKCYCSSSHFNYTPAVFHHCDVSIVYSDNITHLFLKFQSLGNPDNSTSILIS